MSYLISFGVYRIEKIECVTTDKEYRITLESVDYEDELDKREVNIVAWGSELTPEGKDIVAVGDVVVLSMEGFKFKNLTTKK